MVIEGQEGITHINIYSQSNLEIGRWLSNFSFSPINLNEGKFDSVEGYWYFLLTGNQELKKLSGFEAKKVGRLYLKEIESKIVIDETFKNKIKKAIDIKLKTYLDKAREFSKTDLPLCHYYENETNNRTDAGYEWITEHLELRRIQLKEYYYNKEVIKLIIK